MKGKAPSQLTLEPFNVTPPGVPYAYAAPKQHKPAAAIAAHDRFLRRREVQHDTGLSRSALYRLIAAKEFPVQVRLSANTVAWLRSEVDAWIASRVAGSRQAASKSSKVAC